MGSHAATRWGLGSMPIPMKETCFLIEPKGRFLPFLGSTTQDHFVLKHGKLYADKAYADAAWAKTLKKDHALESLIPRKKHNGDVLILGDAFSTFVSSIRQPIECFFNWLNRLTNIQSICLVRSLSGLLFHVFAQIAAPISLIFNS